MWNKILEELFASPNGGTWTPGGEDGNGKFTFFTNVEAGYNKNGDYGFKYSYSYSLDNGQHNGFGKEQQIGQVVVGVGFMKVSSNNKQSSWYETGGRANWCLGTTASLMEFKGGINVIDMYARGVRNGLNGNYQLTGRNLNLFRNAAMTSRTAPISRLVRFGKLFGRASFVGGIIIDGVASYNYLYNPSSKNSVHPAKAILNTGMGWLGLKWNPIAGAIYSGVDALYPGGWGGDERHPGAVRDQAELIDLNREIIPGFNLYRDVYGKQ